MTQPSTNILVMKQLLPSLLPQAGTENWVTHNRHTLLFGLGFQDLHSSIDRYRLCRRLIWSW